MKWRFDKKCGIKYPLPDGTAAECDPDGDGPCCDVELARCSGDSKACLGKDTIDYRIVREIRRTGQSCDVVNTGGFLNTACFDEKKRQLDFRCPHSAVRYKTVHVYGRYFASSLCKSDPFAYQTCGLFSTMISENTEQLCGGYMCANVSALSNRINSSIHQYVECNENCSLHNRDCHIPEKTIKLCDDKCDDPSYCSDETMCGGYRYGSLCKGIQIQHNGPTPIHWVCDGKTLCELGEDEDDCHVTTHTPHTCTHYYTRDLYSKNLTVPILNYTRCAVFGDETSSLYPYCTNYMDQTNCSDVSRILIGGQCSVGGYMSTVSKYVFCDSVLKYRDDPTHIYDDGLENACTSP